jgi:hypothetical protein
MAQVTQLLTRINQTLHSYKLLDNFMGQAREHQHGHSYMARENFKGAIEFRNVRLQYASANEPVFSSLSFRVAPRQRVGVVGRTGAGKSSLTVALFRAVELSGGSITIDGIDHRHVDLGRLRRSLSIIQQEPVLFQGTVRYHISRRAGAGAVLQGTLDGLPPVCIVRACHPVGLTRVHRQYRARGKGGGKGHRALGRGESTLRGGQRLKGYAVIHCGHGHRGGGHLDGRGGLYGGHGGLNYGGHGGRGLLA